VTGTRMDAHPKAACHQELDSVRLTVTGSNAIPAIEGMVAASLRIYRSSASPAT
jgi:hypothetical protein